MNKLTIIGNISTDITVKTVNTRRGQMPVANFNIAVNRRNKADGAIFFSAVAWGDKAETIAKYTAKGQKIALMGPVDLKEYNGRSKMEITVDDWEFAGSSAPRAESTPAPKATYVPEVNAKVDVYTGEIVGNPTPAGFTEVDEYADEDLPF